MLYGELGRYPIEISVKKRIIGFWYSMALNPNNLSSALYRFIYLDHTRNENTYKWLSCVQSILDECRLGYIWINQGFAGTKSMLLSKIETSLLADIDDSHYL